MFRHRMSACVKVLDVLKNLGWNVQHAKLPTVEVFGPGTLLLEKALLIARNLHVSTFDEASCLKKMLGKIRSHLLTAVLGNATSAALLRLWVREKCLAGNVQNA